MRTVLARAFVIATACYAVAAVPPQAGPSGVLTGNVTTYVIEKGDTLRHIAARFGVDPSAVIADNELRRGAPLGAGQRLVIDNRHIVPAGADVGTIVINVPQRILFFSSAAEGRRGIPIAAGSRDWPTPRRAFTVASKEVNPTWDVPASILEEARRAGRTLPPKVPPGPNNPLGKYWLGLSIGGIGIHGTNAPSSIFQLATHGCIRLAAEDIAWLFSQVQVGTPGRIVYEPVLLAAERDHVFLEVHPDVYQRARTGAAQTARELAAAAGVTDQIDWTTADEMARARHGVARAVQIGNKPREPQNISH